MGKYFKYAVGEILLVVIGILIALQVSNWNEKRKELIVIENQMDKLEDELILTIRNASHDIKNSTRADTIIKNVLNNKVSMSDYQNNPYLPHLTSWRFTLDPNLDNMYNLVKKEDVLPAKYDVIMPLIRRMNFVIGRENDEMNQLKASSEKNLEFINMNYTWARKSDSLSLAKAYNYYLNDVSYKNRLYSHWKKAMDYTYIISLFRAQSLIILSYLKSAREDYDASDLKPMLEELDQNPFILAEQDTLPDPEPPINISQCPIIINWTNDTVNLKINSRNDSLIYELDISPTRIVILPTDAGNLSTDYLRHFETYKNDELQNKYIEVPNGFLIIE